MAEGPKYVRNRNNEIAERKMKCPFYTVSNLTYRKVVSHYSDVHQEERKLVGIKCRAEGCKYMCNNGINCFKAHLKKVHANNRSTSYKLCRVKKESNDHSKRCNRITDKFMVEKLAKFSDKLARKKAKEMKEKDKISKKEKIKNKLSEEDQNSRIFKYTTKLRKALKNKARKVGS